MESRWWAITEPTKLYSQEYFKSRDAVLTFHVGLSIRMSSFAIEYLCRSRVLTCSVQLAAPGVRL